MGLQKGFRVRLIGVHPGFFCDLETSLILIGFLIICRFVSCSMCMAHCLRSIVEGKTAVQWILHYEELLLDQLL